MSAARERCTVSRFHKGFASTLTKARNRPPLLLPFYRVASYSQPRFHLKAWSLMDSDKRVSGTRIASKRVSTACSASRLTLTLRSMNRNFNHNIYYIYSIFLNFVLNIVNVCQNVFFYLQMKDANSYAFVVMKEMGWNNIACRLLDATFFTVFLQSISSLAVHRHPHPELHIAGTNKHRGNLVVTYAWAPRVLSDESSLSLPYTSHHHPVCSVCSTARFVFWVKAGAAVALKNNGNKRGRPARVLAQGSHGHGGHVSQNVVSYMYTVWPRPLCTPTTLPYLPRVALPSKLCMPICTSHLDMSIVSWIIPTSTGNQRPLFSFDLYYKLGFSLYRNLSRRSYNKSFSLSLMIVNSIRDGMKGINRFRFHRRTFEFYVTRQS